LGESSNQIKNSITSIKELEKHRSLVFLSKNLLDVDDSSSFVLRNASNLSVDLIDDGERVQEDQEDLLIPIINLKKVKVKGNQVSIRRSSRIKKLKILAQ
jgi:hypothetical protein